ncbi:MAG: AraC family transcriptional regulator [Candidatus Limivicinus sp.]|nr:AraC family transcriptional regulator [Candidatus Limivicinus sp.]
MTKDTLFNREGYLEENYHYFHLRDTAGQERDFHFHEFDKVVVLLSGHVDYTVEDITYALKPWDVLLVKHHTIHKALIDKTEPYDRVIIYLDGKYFDRIMPNAGLMDCFEKADKDGRQRITPDDGQQERLAAALEDYEAAMRDEELGAEAIRDTQMVKLLVLINRIYASGSAAPDRAEATRDLKIAAVLSYINENLGRELSVDELAEQAYLSRYHFMRLFKAQTGSTVHAYVRQKRLLYAARLIREGESAARAAAESGFSDYSAFHRAFRECFGISPGQLKK